MAAGAGSWLNTFSTYTQETEIEQEVGPGYKPSKLTHSDTLAP